MAVIYYKIDGAWKEIGRSKTPETRTRTMVRGDKQFTERWRRTREEAQYRMITDGAWIQGPELETWEKGAKADWTGEERLKSIRITFDEQGVATCDKSMQKCSPESELIQRKRKFMV